MLLEAIRNGTAPAAIITSSIDPIIGLGAILGDELYAEHPVLVVVEDAERKRLKTGDWVSIEAHGLLTVTPRRS